MSMSTWNLARPLEIAREDVGRAMRSILDELALRARLELEDEFVQET